MAVRGKRRSCVCCRATGVRVKHACAGFGVRWDLCVTKLTVLSNVRRSARRPTKEPRTTRKSPNDCLLELRLHCSITIKCVFNGSSSNLKIHHCAMGRIALRVCFFPQRPRSSHASPMYRNAGTHLLLPPFDLPSFRFQSHTPCFTHSHRLPYLVGSTSIHLSPASHSQHASSCANPMPCHHVFCTPRPLAIHGRFLKRASRRSYVSHC